MAGRRTITALFAFASILCLRTAVAATYQFGVLLDADNNAATGCTSPLADGSSFQGVEGILLTTVAADDTTSAGKVVGIAMVPCVTATRTFGPPSPLDTGQWSAAGPNLAVETRISIAQLRSIAPAWAPGSVMRLAFSVAPASGAGGDSIKRDEGSAILFPPPPVRRRAVGGARTIVLDGKTLDWTGVASLPADGSSYRGAIRLAEAYVTGVGDYFYFLIDAGIGGGTFKALPDAFPRSGPAPLTVTFVTKAEYSDVQLLRYRWDFEGDGIFDTDDPGAKNYTRTFTTPGVRNALLEITNERKQVATGIVPITITGAPPTVAASVSPSNGPAPLLVTLTGTASAGTAPIARYEWDFEGDGIFDFSSTTTGITTHTYTTARTYNATFRVTDTAGMRTTARTGSTAVHVGAPGAPTVHITLPSGPTTRTAPISLGFSGSATTPTGTITKYEWDFDGDGAFDFSSPTSASTAFLYNSPGTYTATLRATNSAGIRGMATVDVTITMTARLTLIADTLRPPGTAGIGSTISGTAPISIFIRNEQGQTVRTLVKNVTRAPGAYVDPWDGMTDGGVLVPEGVYLAILQYLTNTGPVTVDLTATGRDFYNPPWDLSTTKQGSCSACVFAPYDDDFLEATFTLARASEVTVSIRGYDTVNEVSLLFDRRLFGSGRPYKAVWDGTNAKGQLVHPSLYNDPQFIFGMTAFTLPDNAIFVERAPELTDVTITPNYFDPFTGDFLTPQKPNATIAYTLSKPARVRLQVFRVGTNVILRTIDRPNTPSGRGTVVWDGRDDRGIFADKGDYRLALTATDSAGHQSLVRYGLMKVFY